MTVNKDLFRKLYTGGLSPASAEALLTELATAVDYVNDTAMFPANAVPDLANGATLAEVTATVNTLLAHLRGSGLLAP